MQSDPTKQFDFWLGNWTMETETRPDPRVDNWKKSQSKNKVERVMDGKVIQENFSGVGLVGKSWSVYDPTAKLWRQTWVDNQSSYITLTGKWEGDKMVLLSIPQNAGAKVHRMVFQDITPKSFLWKWEVQMTDGNWGAMFVCHYKRAK